MGVSAGLGLSYGEFRLETSKIRPTFRETFPSARNTRVMRSLCKSLILTRNRGLQIFGLLFVVQKVLNIVLNIPVLACESYPLSFQKLSFCTLKAILSHYKRIPFAKPEVKNGILSGFRPRSHSGMLIFRTRF
jgi:hypothetical protein